MNNPSPDLHTTRYNDIKVGAKVAHNYVITHEVYDHFLAAFHDYSPVHVDEEFARSQGFLNKVMHGALLNGFISHFVGMKFPGRFGLLLSSDLRFSNPSYLGDTIHLEAVVSQKLDARHVVVLDLVLTNGTRNHLAARGRIQVMVKEAA